MCLGAVFAKNFKNLLQSHRGQYSRRGASEFRQERKNSVAGAIFATPIHMFIGYQSSAPRTGEPPLLARNTRRFPFYGCHFTCSVGKIEHSSNLCADRFLGVQSEIFFALHFRVNVHYYW